VLSLTTETRPGHTNATLPLRDNHARIWNFMDGAAFRREAVPWLPPPSQDITEATP